MSPKRKAAGSGKASTRKSTARKAVAPSPMRKVEHAVGPRPDALAEQARAAHTPPVEERVAHTPQVGRSTPPPMNTPPSSPATSQVDEGQRE